MQETHKRLQKVAIDLLSVQRRAHLVSIFETTFKSDVGYTQAAIFILNTESNQFNNLLQPDDRAQAFSLFTPHILLRDLAVDEVILSNSPDQQGFSEFNVGENWPLSTLNKYLSQAPPPGSRMLSFSLREGNDFLGNLLLLFADSTKPLLDKDELLMLALTINLVVIHVMTEEHKLTQIKNTHLVPPFSPSLDLLGAHDYTDLKRIVQDTLLPLVKAVSCVALLESDRETCRCLMVVNNSATVERSIPEDSYTGSFSDYRHWYGKPVPGEKLVVYKQEALMDMAHNVPHLQAELGNGVIEKIMYPLDCESKTRGMIFLNYAHKHSIAEVDIQAVKLVLAQFSKIIFQLVDQEQVQTRIAQQDVVIRLGAQMAAIRSHDDLLEVLSKRIKPLIGFTHTSITGINRDRSTPGTFLLDYHELSRYPADYAQVVSEGQAINEEILDQVLVSDDPLVFDLETLSHARLLPSFLKMNVERDIRYVVMTKFLKGNKAFGVWILTFDYDYVLTTNTLPLIRDVASQLSVSVQNILINLAYERRETEKNRLMQFSRAIASIQDRNKLAKTIKEHLSDLFSIDDFLLWSLSADLQNRSPVLFDKSSSLTHHPWFQTATDEHTTNADEIYDMLVEGSGIVYVEANELRMIYADHPYFLDETDANPSMGLGGIVLRVGDEIVGLLTFFTRQFQVIQEKEDLFSSLCSQLAVMASTMITADKISEQLAEIKKYNERLEDEKIYLLRELETPATNSDMIGTSSEIQAVLKLIQQVAYTDSTVLILGETGTGKELVARSIHNNSPRKSKLMVKVNCAALPANLVESELFGHEKGSFTGASERRIGKFELANQGTLFLDEIGEMPLDLQGKLLRALQEKEIERVGGKSVIKVDVRVIVATNRHLEKEVAQGTFRSDLFYRINVFPIRLPALRDRLSDMPLLASHFITKYALKAGKDIKSLSSAVLQELQRYDWPGNIRELEHLIERSVLLTKGDTLTVVDLPKSHSATHDRSMYLDKRILTLDENERDHILRIIKMCRGRINGQHGAAKLLGIPPSTLTSKMKRLDIRKQEIRF
ncbi:hypothetical protein BH09BAC4_BH09BAC4_01330 [soil metagenome]